VAADGVPTNGGIAASHISAPLSIASNNGLDLEPLNKRRDDDFGGLSKSHRSFVNESTM
jgi:hypothetical protein